jgi:lipopolysaccharide export system permease protein
VYRYFDTGKSVLIIRRYIASQVLLATVAVAAVLTVILMSGRVIRYFGMAASGKLDVSLLTAVLVYRLPQFMELIVPLGMFIAILLVFGRLYLDNEMAVLAASGVSRAQTVGNLAFPVLLVTLAVGGISLYLTPVGNAASDQIFAEQAKRNTFDLIKPGRFQRAGQRMLYAEKLSPDKTELLGVYLFEPRNAVDGGPPRQIMVYAESGRRYVDPQTHLQYLQLHNGRRYELQPGGGVVNQARFGEFRALMPQADMSGEAGVSNPNSTPDIIARMDRDPAAMSEWMWRVSMPALVPIVALLAFALSKVNPRQGRYLKLLPAILLYLSYIVMIVAARNGIEKGKLTQAASWGVHAVYLLLALSIVGWEQIKLWLRGLTRREAAA